MKDETIHLIHFAQTGHSNASILTSTNLDALSNILQTLPPVTENPGTPLEWVDGRNITRRKLCAFIAQWRSQYSVIRISQTISDEIVLDTTEGTVTGDAVVWN